MSNPEVPKVSAPSRGATHVTVACKLPAGLIMRLYNMVEQDEPVLGGGSRRVRVAEYDQERGEIKLNGYAAPANQRATAELAGVGKFGVGYALTPGVPADFWEDWKRANADLPALKQGLVFAHSSRDQVLGVAKDSRGLKNGMEPIDPEKPPAVSRTLKVEKYKKEEAA